MTKSYLAGEAFWRYTEPAPRSTKILILNAGGVAIIGDWVDSVGHLAWSPLPKRNHKLEQALKDIK